MSLLDCVSMHFRPHFIGCKHSFSCSGAANISRVQEVPHATSTFLILPLDAASCLLTMAGMKSSGEGCFSERGSGLYLISSSGTAETTEGQPGRVHEKSNIRTERPRSRDFPPADNHVSRDRGRDGVLFSSPPPAAPSPTISETD